MTTKIEELKALMQDTQNQLRAKGAEAVIELCKQYFDTNPTLQAVNFKCYTDYFNDGDTCNYNINNVNVYVGANHKPCIDDALSADNRDETETTGWFNVYACIGWDEVVRKSYFKGTPEAVVACEIAKELDAVFDNLEDLFKTAFGDHIQVTVFRDGSFQVDDYTDHD